MFPVNYHHFHLGERIGSMLPKIRTNLEFMPAATEGGEEVMVIRDPLGIMEAPVVINQVGLVILSMMEQCRSRDDLQALLTKAQGGELITTETVQEMIDRFDNMLILQTEKYREAYGRLVDEFNQVEVREAACAGGSYPEDREELQAYIREILADSPRESGKGQPLALVSPHLDIRVGTTGYAHAYGALGEVRPELVIVLGVGHKMGPEYFCFTKKDFATPLGVVKTNRELMSRFDRFEPPVASPDDFPHKQEHSIEFQLVFLQELLPDDLEFEILPILCGSFFTALQDHNRPREIPGVVEVLEELEKIIAAYEGKVLVVSGVDFSHVGPKFGDQLEAKEIVSEAEKHDRALLEALCDRNVESFWAESRRVEDKYRVCGFSSMSCLLEILPSCRPQMLHYDTWFEEPTRSSVSYAAVVFDE